MIGAQLQANRQAAGLTQEQVAAQLYITRQTISRWEQDKTMPNIYALKDLAALYGVSLDALVTAPDPISSNQEATPMKKINWFSLFGVFWFNLLVMLAVVLTAGTILITLWFCAGVFIASPVILGVMEALDALGWLPAAIIGEEFNWWGQWIASLALAGLGAACIPLLWRLTQFLTRFFKQYLRYNVRAVYHA